MIIILITLIFEAAYDKITSVMHNLQRGHFVHRLNSCSQLP